MAKIFKANGEVTEVTPENGTDFSYVELKKIVNGYIQVIPAGHAMVMVLNEEGKLLGMPFNENATRAQFFRTGIEHILVGDVLLCKSNEVR